MRKIYCACYMGQFGYLFSMGIPRIASRLRSTGATADVFYYDDIRPSWAKVLDYQDRGYKIVLIGYSLGVSGVTYVQQRLPTDLVVCLAASNLAINYPINHKLCKQSVLWHGPGILSSAGKNLGFDVVKEISAPHLWIDLSPTVTDDILWRVKQL